MRITLTVTDGPHKGMEFSFARHDTFLVGRSRHAHFQLPLKDRYFSRIHFMIEVNPPQCRLVDMGSHNGTYVNGQKTLAADLNDGDQIRAGHTLLKLSMSREPGETMIPGPIEAAKKLPIAQPVEFTPDFVPGYFLEQKLGKGNMGTVYRARRLADEANVAMKLIRPANPGRSEHIEAFLTEARGLTSLTHPGIVRFLDVSESRGVLAIVSAYVPGTDAGAMLRNIGPLPPRRAIPLIAQVLQALEHGHALGMVHRDIKPTNLIISGDGERETVKLADYGLARVYHASPLSGLTITRDIVASAPFMPPELITNYREPSALSDQYSAAATLYTLLTGQPVYDFPKESHLQFSLLLQQQPVPIRQRRAEISEALAGVIHKALQRNRANRYPDVAAFRAALLQAVGDV